MKTINEIKLMPLLDAQQLVLELRGVNAKDKFYPAAVSLISVATSRKDWKEPQTIEVKNTADHDVTIDRTTIAKDGTGKVYPWQYVANLRFLEAVEKDDHDSAVKNHIRVPLKGENDTADDRTAQIVTATIKALVKEGVLKVAAMLMLLAILCFGGSTARCQETGQSFVVGPYPSAYNVVLINTGSNAWTAATGGVQFTNTITNAISITTNVSFTIVNGSTTAATNYSTNTVTSVPGAVFVGNFDQVNLGIGFQPQSGGPPTLTAVWDTSDDGTNWQLSTYTEVVASNSIANTGGVGYMAATNLSLGPGFGPGWVRLNNLALAGSTGWGTNIFAHVGKKPSKTGP